MSTIADATFRITNTKLWIPIVTLSSKANVKLVKLSEKGFKRPGLLGWVPHKNRIKKFRQKQSYKIFAWCFVSTS